jgi:hypothetical protein
MNEKKRDQIRNPEKGCVDFEHCFTVAEANPSGLDLLVLPFPGLAEKRQPWAGGLNPFGIHIPLIRCW